MRRFLVRAVLLVGLGILPASAQSPPNLVMISLDTTRFDHLGAGGHSVPVTPVLDRLARQSHFFSNAHSVIPLTGPAHASIMTGLYPHAHGAIRNGKLLRQDVPTLAELLSEKGFQTAAFVSGWTMRSKISGVHRGFDVWNEEMTDHYKVLHTNRHADEVTDQALGWLDRSSPKPFFLFVHYFDAHDPYEERAPWFSNFHQGYWTSKLGEKPGRKLAAYDSEIAFIDGQVGRVVEALQKKNLLDNTWIVLLADHGEAFGEHGYQRHGRRIHQPAMRVLTALRPPGGLAQQHLIRNPVSQVDLLPTLAEIFGLSVHRIQGKSLGELMKGGTIGPRPPIYFEAYTLWSLRRKKLPVKLGVLLGRYKIVLSPREDRFEIFDLARDPRELVNLADKLPQLAKHREGLLDWWRSTRTLLDDKEPQLSAEDLERLRDLGYVN